MTDTADPLLDPALPVTAESVAALQTKLANLYIALRTRDTIGMAKGILMAMHKVGDDEAFGMLTACSHVSNRKVHDLAAEIVATGSLPAAAVPDAAGTNVTAD